MNIRYELLIYILSVMAFSGKNGHHHHHHHGNGIDQRGKHVRRSKRRCIQKMLEAIGGEASSTCNHGGAPGESGSPLVLPPGAKKTPSNTDFLITEATPDNRPDGYTPTYASSRVYKITANKDVDASFILISAERNFYPQIKISKSSGKIAFEEAVPYFSGPQSSKSYQIKKGEDVAIEIGHDSSFDSRPFSNSAKTGGFMLIISLNGKTLENYLEKSKISTSGSFSGTVATAPGSPLLLSASWLPNLDHGLFNAKLTPYYNTTKSSITLYYHNGSNFNTGSVHRSSTIEQYCKENADETNTTRGTEPSGGRYVWENVPSKKICDLRDFLKEFN